jgi:hypothetical protein
MNFRNSSSSSWDSGISFPGKDDGASGFNSIAWSQIRDGGNLCDVSLLNTLVKLQYCGGMASRFVSPLSELSSTRLIKYRLSQGGHGWFIDWGRNWAFFMSGIWKIIGSWE